MKKKHIVKVPTEFLELETEYAILMYLTSFVKPNRVVQYKTLNKLPLNYTEVEITYNP